MHGKSALVKFAGKLFWDSKPYFYGAVLSAFAVEEEVLVFFLRNILQSFERSKLHLDPLLYVLLKDRLPGVSKSQAEPSDGCITDPAFFANETGERKGTSSIFCIMYLE